MKNKISSLLIIILLTTFFTLAPFGCKGEIKVPEPSYWPTAGWEFTSPESQGVDSEILTEGLIAVKDKNLNIHSLMIVRNDLVILDSYFYPYDGSTYHDIASVTKSITTTLIGIAADQGILDVDDPILSFFPDRKIANLDHEKEQITIRHLVSNSSGYLFNERDDAATISVMTENEDWIQAALDPPLAHKPGTHFAYYSPGMHLLSAILQESTGMTEAEFADANLFKPLGIDEFYWPSDPQGYTVGLGDLCLYPEDMAKIGLLFMQQGKWEGKQIVSSKWINQATKKQLAAEPDRGEDYGYGWWISRPDEEIPYYRAEGRGGQNIIVVPSMNMLLITTGGGYDFDAVAKYVVGAMKDLEKPLTPNPSAVEELNNISNELKSPPESLEVSPLPEIASNISGKTFVFKPNELTIEYFSLSFDDKKEAMLNLKVENEPLARILSIGLDGIWKPSVNGISAVSQGYWEDENNFIWEYSEGPGLNNYKFKLNFKDNKVILEVLLPATIAGLTIEGNFN